MAKLPVSYYLDCGDARLGLQTPGTNSASPLKWTENAIFAIIRRLQPSNENKKHQETSCINTGGAKHLDRVGVV